MHTGRPSGKKSYRNGRWKCTECESVGHFVSKVRSTCLGLGPKALKVQLAEAREEAAGLRKAAEHASAKQAELQKENERLVQRLLEAQLSVAQRTVGPSRDVLQLTATAELWLFNRSALPLHYQLKRRFGAEAVRARRRSTLRRKEGGGRKMSALRAVRSAAATAAKAAAAESAAGRPGRSGT